MEQRAEMLRAAQDLRLRQAGVIVFDQRQATAPAHTRAHRAAPAPPGAEPGTHYAVAAFISERALTIAARYWRARSSITSNRPAGDRFVIDQFAAHAARARSRLQELADGFQVHAAGRHHLDLRKRPFQRLDVLRAADIAARENLDRVGAGFPGGQDLGRRQRARDR